jgi:hypothetical protein
MYVGRVDADFSKQARSQALTDGSTAVVAVIAQGRLYVANGILLIIDIFESLMLLDLTSWGFASSDCAKRRQGAYHVNRPSTREERRRKPYSAIGWHFKALGSLESRRRASRVQVSSLNIIALQSPPSTMA